MRFDRCIGMIVAMLLSVSTIALIHGIYMQTFLSQDAETVSRRRSHPNIVVDSSSHNNLRHRPLEHPPDTVSSSTAKKKASVKNKKSYFWGVNKAEASKMELGWSDEKKKKKNTGDAAAGISSSSSSDSCSEEYHNSLPTYDDYIAPGISRAKRAEIAEEMIKDHSGGKGELQSSPCDPYTVPFVSSSASRKKQEEAEQLCLSTMSDPTQWEHVDMIEPRFEQRTVKYIVRLRAPSSHIRLLMKVPQASFATEPFGEITAFALDRMLKMGRIPPTVLVPFPLKRLHEAAYRVMDKFKMPQGLDYTETNFTKWWESEFYRFVVRSRQPKVTTMMMDDGSGNGSRDNNNKNPAADRLLLWVSLQLRLEGVVDLLESPLRVPYSKKQSGWHRWFNPRWEGFSAVTNTKRLPDGDTDLLQAGYERHSIKPYNELLHASMMALSELAIFDYVMLNNDRSPNKNNFVVEGCYQRRRRRKNFAIINSDNNNNNNNNENGGGGGGNNNEQVGIIKPGDPDYKPKDKFCSAAQIAKGYSANGRERMHRGNLLTFVHLDQGMAFHGFSHVNNPIAKKVNSSFCMFYKPLMERIRCFLTKYDTPEAAEAALRGLVPPVAEEVLGRRRVRWMIGQLSTLASRKNACLEKYGEEIVLQPSRFPDLD